MRFPKLSLLSFLLPLLFVIQFISAAAQNTQSEPVKGNQGTSSKLLLHVVAEKKRPQKPGAVPLDLDMHVRYASFITESDFASEALIENLRLDIPVTVSAILILPKAEVQLETITISAHGTSTLDINRAISAHGLQLERGTIAIRYGGDSYGAVSMVVTSANETRHLYLSSIGQSPEEFWYGTALDAVVWAPDKETTGYVFVMNTTAETRKVEASFFANRRTPEKQQFELKPHEFRFVNIDTLLQDTAESASGIRVSFTGQPGDIITEGTLLNRKSGFSKHIRFLDTALHFSDHSLRTHFLLLGRQPDTEGFPAQISFHSVAAIRNVDSIPVQVQPTLRRMAEGGLQEVKLAPVLLQPQQSCTLDFNAEQKKGTIPADWNQASLELKPDSNRNSIVAELFNVDETSNSYVVGSSFAAFPTRATGSIWRIDGSFQTTVMVQNTSSQADTLTVKLFSNQSDYIKTIPVPAGHIIKINIRELQQNQVPDDSGNFLTATSGTLSLSGGLGIHSHLSYDKLIHSADQSEYVGLLANPCNYVTGIGLFFLGTDDPYSVDVEVEADWTDGSLTDGPASDLSSGNNSLASVNGNIVTVNPVDASSHNVGLSDMELETACDICSGDDFFANASVTVPPKPSLSCSPNPVVRAQNATCTINPGVSGAIYSGWSFSDGTNTVTTNSTAASWSGTIVKAGTVSANVSIGSRPAVSVSANLGVNNRTGFAFSAVSPQVEPDPFSGNGCSLNVPNPPVSSGDAIGMFCLTQHFVVQTLGAISSGPNTGYSYVSSVSSSDASGSTAYYYVIAPDAQNTSSTFYQAQCGNYNAQTNPNGFISGANLLANTTRHESGTVQSHYENYVVAQGLSTNNLGTVAEAIVEKTDPNTLATDVTSTLNGKLSTILTAAQVEPCDVTHNASCVFQGFINFLQSSCN
jgi:hypothetical protein